MKKSLSFASIAAIATPAMVLAAAPDAAREARVDAVFAAYGPSVPGCAVGVEQDGRTLFARGYGVADLEAKRPLTPASSVYMASVSKQVAAMAVLLLVEDGKLRLDDRARSIIPELPAYADQVTVRQLLTHNSGLRDFFTLGGISGYADDRPYSEKDVLDLLGRQQGLDFEPDTDHLYSNSGYVALSLIVQRVSGQRLDDFARARIFNPLGMTKTRFQHDHTQPVPDKANGYVKAGEGWKLSNSYLDVVGDGGLYSTTGDMLRWIANMDGGKVGAPSVALMRESARLKDGTPTGYGMGLAPGSYRGLPLVQHGGGLAGYRTMTYWFPTEKLGIVISCNNGEASSGALASKVADIYLDGKLKPQTVLSDVAPDEAARPLAGVYRDKGGMYFELALNDGKLATVRPPWSLAQLSPGVFALPTDPDGVRFRFDADGKGFSLASEGGRARRFERVEKQATTGAEAAAYVGSYQSPEVPAPITIRQDGGLKLKIGELPELPLFQTAPDRLWAPDAGLELLFIRDAAGTADKLLLNAGRARGLKYARTGS
ncbi:serine hydrolase domain-containing protein [Sphingosinicella rhizophila]|uniref:Serine hydrolase domain-containing protein n=1 Tax=Sphingosinicella rhizophila TaxID=3050082 RepID=A0ABU3Q9J9_9SPHN|nr:serine hydrolase domain-containing protein [Sphingosinicella sp. GR2756]MDT9600067.1 serine hydrolase domain-containing protein [Sphingosinicella sp. GR2756]